MLRGGRGPLGRVLAVEAVEAELTGALAEALHAIGPEALNALRQLERTGIIDSDDARRPVSEPTNIG